MGLLEKKKQELAEKEHEMQLILDKARRKEIEGDGLADLIQSVDDEITVLEWDIHNLLNPSALTKRQIKKKLQWVNRERVLEIINTRKAEYGINVKEEDIIDIAHLIQAEMGKEIKRFVTLIADNKIEIFSNALDFSVPPGEDVAMVQMHNVLVCKGK